MFIVLEVVVFSVPTLKHLQVSGGDGNVTQVVRRKRDNSTSQVSGYYPDDTDKCLKFAGKSLILCFFVYVKFFYIIMWYSSCINSNSSSEISTCGISVLLESLRQCLKILDLKAANENCP